MHFFKNNFFRNILPKLSELAILNESNGLQKEYLYVCINK